MVNAVAVADPEVSTDTEAEVVVDTEDTTGVTDDTANVQTDAAKDDTPDPVATAIASALEAEREVMREQLREEERNNSKSTEQQALRETLKEHFPAHLRALDNDLTAMGLDPADRQKAINHLHAYNLKAQEAILGPFEDATVALLPAASRDAFIKDANGKPAEAYMKLFGEYLAEGIALNTKAVKSADPATLIAANSKLKAHMDKEIATAVTNDQKRRAAEVGGERRVDERGGAGRNIQTQRDADAAHIRGDITSAERKVIKANPAIPY